MSKTHSELIDLTVSDGEEEELQPQENQRQEGRERGGPTCTSADIISGDDANVVDGVGMEGASSEFAELLDDPLIDSLDLASSEVPPVRIAKRKLQTHPLKIIQAEQKRRKERKAYWDKKRQEAAEAAAKRLAEEAASKAAALEAARRNFVIIDDSSDDEGGEPGPQRRTQSTRSRSGSSSTKRTYQSYKAPLPNGFQKRRHMPQARNRMSDDPNYYRFDDKREFNWNYSQEAALEEQERLLRESAARFRAQSFVSPNEVEQQRNRIPCIQEPLFDIAARYPDHWQWKDAYANLGLPHGAALSLVRTQYRRLAKQYHPDKSQTDDTIQKFHGISRAYRKLTES